MPREATAELRELYSPEVAPDATTVKQPLGVDVREVRFSRAGAARARRPARTNETIELTEERISVECETTEIKVGVGESQKG